MIRLEQITGGIGDGIKCSSMVLVTSIKLQLQILKINKNISRKQEKNIAETINKFKKGSTGAP